MEYKGNEKESVEPEDENKAVSSQVLEYYQKYSQNRQLPKFFSGVSSTFVLPVQEPVSVQEVVVETLDQIIEDVIEPCGSDVNSNVKHSNDAGVTSPTSSITSNRKLEWDSGADIGYCNAAKSKILQKSISLPVLTDVIYEKLQNSEKFIKDISRVESDIASNEDSKQYYRSSSTLMSLTHDRQHLSDSETNSDIQADIQFVKGKVGLPIAESTPRIHLESISDPEMSSYSETPKLKQLKEQLNSRDCGKIDLNMVDRVSHYKNMKVLKLTASKPILVECASSFHENLQTHKLIQTSLPRNMSVAVQTSFDLSNCQKIKVDDSEKQCVFYVCHSDSDKKSSRASTNSDVAVSNCNSFEFLPGSNYEGNLQPQQSFSRSDSSKTSTTNVSEVTSKESPLAHLLTSSQSDIQNILKSLQRVMQSNKYNNTTKKYYLKKIMEKIISLEVIDSKQSSTISSKSNQPLETEPTEIVSSTRQSPISKESVDTVTKQPTKESSKSSQASNTDSIIVISTKEYPNINNFQTEIFTTDIFPEKTATHKDKRLQRNPLFTLTAHSLLGQDSDFRKASPIETADKITTSSTKSTPPEESKSKVSTPQPSTNSSSQSKQSGQSLNKELDSWRTDKTRSEQLLEQGTGDSVEKKDHLLCFAQKEREHQLYWINNEISHLSKLKQLLEQKQPDSLKNLNKDLQKPHVEDMPGLQNSTSVYVLTTEKTKRCPRCKNNPKPASQDNKCKKCKCELLPTMSVNTPVVLDDNATIEVGNEKINLKNARLVSSEQFSVNTDDAKCNTVIRRYTFELPTEQIRANNVIKMHAEGSSTSNNKQTKQLTHELVLTDDIPSKYANDQTKTSSSSLSTTESDLTSLESSTSNLCQCCRKESVHKPPKSQLRNEQKEEYVLCYPCYNQNKQRTYMYPGHICNCYNRTKTINEIKNTVKQLTDLEDDDDEIQICRCCKPKSQKCKFCSCKTRAKRGGMAYLLTFESDDTVNEKEKKKKKKPSLQEIKFKIPSSYSRKKREFKQISDNSDATNSCEEQSKENINKKKHKKKHKSKRPTLQEYLCANKPTFVASAEQRRRCLIELAYMREQRCQKYKQLLASTRDTPIVNVDSNLKKKPQMFSSKEMKEITAKNYKKLPEVQQKLENNKEKQIKKANKLLTEIFNKNLREQVLKGKHTIPTDASIIKLC